MVIARALIAAENVRDSGPNCRYRYATGSKYWPFRRLTPPCCMYRAQCRRHDRASSLDLYQHPFRLLITKINWHCCPNINLPT